MQESLKFKWWHHKEALHKAISMDDTKNKAHEKAHGGMFPSITDITPHLFDRYVLEPANSPIESDSSAK